MNRAGGERRLLVAFEKLCEVGSLDTFVTALQLFLSSITGNNVVVPPGHIPTRCAYRDSGPGKLSRDINFIVEVSKDMRSYDTLCISLSMTRVMAKTSS
ncbi:hypothetical protein, partial [Acidilobus sp.]|uniref:hypothetical protein n=1 Tax=Acidilobus sp. TaxID=1872109 RepID=UPI003CFFC617